MPRLLIVRHGQASFGAEDYDRLSDLGTRQATRTAEALRAAGLTVSRVIAGSLRRQRDTAAAIAGAYGLTVAEDVRWNEYDADDLLRHHSSSSVRLEHPGTPEALPGSARAFQAALEAALRSWIDAGAQSGAAEAFPAFADRVAAGLGDAVAPGAAEPGATIVVSSGGAIAAVAAALTGGGAGAFVPLNRVSVNCGISRVISGRAGTSLVSYNEQGHLGAGEVTYR